MKKVSVLSIVILSLFLISSQAYALGISYFGNYILQDTNSDGFSESLTFSNPFGPNSGVIGSFIPTSDGLFNDPGMETVLFSSFTLDPASYSSGSYFDFNPAIYTNGFQIIDDNGDQLLKADFIAERLEVNYSTGSVNSVLTLNLVNIAAGSGYTLGGGSSIIDEFLNPAIPGGAANITLQFYSDLSAAITSGATIYSGYSGSTSPGSPVPEPASIFLLGFSLLLCVPCIRKISKGF